MLDGGGISWPNGKRIAITVNVMLEAWSEGKAPSYSVHATSLKPGIPDLSGKSWSTYGGNVGVWRIIRTLDRWKIPSTFGVNAQCAELYPEAIKQIIRSGHDIAGHGYTQDQLLAYMNPEQEQSTIKMCLDLLSDKSGQRPTGWVSPVHAFTPHTIDFLAKENLKWHGDVTYTDLPQVVKTSYGTIVAVPTSDFSDNRVMRASPCDFYDAYKSTFDYLYEHEPMGMLAVTLHCHFGGRPLIISVFDELLKYFSKHRDVWFVRNHELALWALEANQEFTYASRFFDLDSGQSRS